MVEINQAIDLENATYKTDNSPLLASVFDSDYFSIAFYIKNDNLSSRSVIITRYDNNENPRCGFSSTIKDNGKINIQRLVSGNNWKVLDSNTIIKFKYMVPCCIYMRAISN